MTEENTKGSSKEENQIFDKLGLMFDDYTVKIEKAINLFQNGNFTEANLELKGLHHVVDDILITIENNTLVTKLPILNQLMSQLKSLRQIGDDISIDGISRKVVNFLGENFKSTLGSVRQVRQDLQGTIQHNVGVNVDRKKNE